MNTILIAAIAYVVLLPLTIFIIAKLYKFFRITLKIRRARKKKRKIDYSSLPQPIGPKMLKRVKFAFKDKRGMAFVPKKPTRVQTRWVFFGLWIAGLLSALLAGYLVSFTWGLVSWGLGLIALFFAIKTADKAVRKRNKVVERIADMAARQFKIPRKPEDSPNSIVVVDKWVDYTKPEYVRIMSEKSFDPNAQKLFMEEFNRTYGQLRAWVPDSDAPDTQGTGWDHENGVGYLKSKPPLPSKADWHEDYVLNPGIAWSFFPLALGLEDGVEMNNPFTGEPVNVLGFDVSGLQKDVGKEAGLTVSKNIGTTPQAFIGGSTGGGKAHPIDTPVVVLND